MHLVTRTSHHVSPQPLIPSEPCPLSTLAWLVSAFLCICAISTLMPVHLVHRLAHFGVPEHLRSKFSHHSSELHHSNTCCTVVLHHFIEFLHVFFHQSTMATTDYEDLLAGGDTWSTTNFPVLVHHDANSNNPHWVNLVEWMSPGRVNCFPDNVSG